MKFSSVALIAAMATTASAFAPAFQQSRSNAFVLQKSKGAYDFDGLDTMKFPEPTPEPVKPEPKKKAPKAAKRSKGSGNTSSSDNNNSTKKTGREKRIF